MLSPDVINRLRIRIKCATNPGRCLSLKQNKKKPHFLGVSAWVRVRVTSSSQSGASGITAETSQNKDSAEGLKRTTDIRALLPWMREGGAAGGKDLGGPAVMMKREDSFQVEQSLVSNGPHHYWPV